MSADDDDNIDLTEGLEDQSYEIKDELKMREILEEHTDWQTQFAKNEDYAYDLKISQWSDKPRSDDDKSMVGYVELERSRRDKELSWVTGDIPDGWHFLSFLQRKVREFDYESGQWCGLKDNHSQTVYLKFNHALDNCFAAPITAIHRDGVRTKMSDGTPENTYLKLDKTHNEVCFGITECVEFIERFLNQTEASQADLTVWSDGR